MSETERFDEAYDTLRKRDPNKAPSLGDIQTVIGLARSPGRLAARRAKRLREDGFARYSSESYKVRWFLPGDEPMGWEPVNI